MSSVRDFISYNVHDIKTHSVLFSFLNYTRIWYRPIQEILIHHIFHE